MIRVALEVIQGPSAGKWFELQSGRPVRVGRTSDSELATADPFMSRVHFALGYSEDTCVLKDCSRNGTLVNGARVDEVALQDGHTITAGQTSLVVHIQVVSADPIPGVLENLNKRKEPLYALLDAARSQEVLQLLAQIQAPAESLYAGEQGQLLGHVAPHLVRLDPGSTALDTLTRKAWGQSWGMFVTSFFPFEDLRRHFRQFLLVDGPDGRRLLFRFYDPRVLRVFLPTCDTEQLTVLFAGVIAYLLEGADPAQLLEFTLTGDGLRQVVIPVAARGASAGA